MEQNPKMEYNSANTPMLNGRPLEGPSASSQPLITNSLSQPLAVPSAPPQSQFTPLVGEPVLVSLDGCVKGPFYNENVKNALLNRGEWSDSPFDIQLGLECLLAFCCPCVLMFQMLGKTGEVKPPGLKRMTAGTFIVVYLLIFATGQVLNNFGPNPYCTMVPVTKRATRRLTGLRGSNVTTESGGMPPMPTAGGGDAVERRLRFGSDFSDFGDIDRDREEVDTDFGNDFDGFFPPAVHVPKTLLVKQCTPIYHYMMNLLLWGLMFCVAKGIREKFWVREDDPVTFVKMACFPQCFCMCWQPCFLMQIQRHVDTLLGHKPPPPQQPVPLHGSFPPGVQHGYPQSVQQSYQPGMQQSFPPRVQQSYPPTVQQSYPPGVQQSYPPSGFQQSTAPAEPRF